MDEVRPTFSQLFLTQVRLKDFALVHYCSLFTYVLKTRPGQLWKLQASGFINNNDEDVYRKHMQSQLHTHLHYLA